MEHPATVFFLRNIASRIVEASKLEKPTIKALSSIPREETHAILVAFGKGACSMASGAASLYSGSIQGGVVVVPEGTTCRLNGLEVLESTHPLPSDKSLRAAEAVLEWAGLASRSRTPLIALISGGGSALVEKPLEGLELEDIVSANRVLLEAGLSILEINTIRKHLSQVKGGRLAAKASPSTVNGLYASDVPGDRLDLIASGPTVPDPTTFEDALRIVKTYGLAEKLPRNVMEILEKGSKGLISETPKPGDPVFKRTRNMLVASNIDVLRTLSNMLDRSGYKTLVLTSRLEGESREVGKALASIALEAIDRHVPAAPPLAILAGGETSVTVKSRGGMGGRNMELALSVALRVDYWRPDLDPGRITVLSMDTDGIDGNTPSAGAIAYNGLARKAREVGLDPLGALQRNDTYRFFRELGLTVDTGPTGSNLNSVTVILIS